MLCEKCKQRVATTYIKTVIGGVVTKRHLCSECASEEGFSAFSGSPLDSMISSIFGSNEMGSIGESAVCKKCGTALSSIASSGKVGCPDCYQTFYEELLPYIKRIQGNSSHIGKKIITDTQTKTVDKSKEIQKLKEDLTLAIKEERFEDAAKIRDEIKEKEGENL